MTHPLTDRDALTRIRHRAAKAPVLFLHEEAAIEVEDRLSLVNKAFTDPVVVGGMPHIWQKLLPQMRCIADDDTLDLAPGTRDLVIHALALHWANDPVGQLIQARRALRPDGLFIAVLFGGATLQELRAALAQAEADLFGSLSPRIAPMGEIRDLGAVLQRAGYALPVADSVPLTVSYATPLHLMRDLRAMGEANALSSRSRKPMQRALLERTCEIYHEAFPAEDTPGRIRATFELIVLTGWSPDPSQQQPLRPGSAATRLAQALGTMESPLKD